MVALLAATVMILGACAGGTDEKPGGGKPVDGGTATVALPPGEQPNYVFPFLDWAHQSITNVAMFQKLMYRPLYWASVDGNQDLALAEPVAWSKDLRTATIALRDYEWSDGTKLSPANVAFWMGLVQYAGDGWTGNSMGLWPDKLQKVSYDEDAGTVTFELTEAVSPTWFQDNILANSTPLPVAWDLEGESKKGNCSSFDPDKQKASCPRVLAYLTEQAEDLSTYATNPLWQVVNGPWKIDEFKADGHVRLVPNDTYSGPTKPTLDAVEFVPFTSESAEFNALKSGKGPHVGYVPTGMAPKADKNFEPVSNPLGSRYKISPRFTWGFNYLILNQQNPRLGPIFRQLYFRQALQATVDQKSDIAVAMKGYGVVTNSPIPVKPDNDIAGDANSTVVQDFSVEEAKELLTDNGWDVPEGGGVATCADPGTGVGQCGEGIKAGTKAAFELESMSGSTTVSTMMEQLRSAAAQAGIQITLKEAPYNTVIANVVTCTEDDQACGWEAGHWGAGWTFLTSFYPTGEKLMGTGGGSNYSNYSDPTMDQLVAATISTEDPEAMPAYAQYAAEQFPVTYLPTSVDLVAVDSRLAGVTPISPLQVITPENWHFTR